jgi:hypothetical protein
VVTRATHQLITFDLTYLDKATAPSPILSRCRYRLQHNTLITVFAHVKPISEPQMRRNQPYSARLTCLTGTFSQHIPARHTQNNRSTEVSATITKLPIEHSVEHPAIHTQPPCRRQQHTASAQLLHVLHKCRTCPKLLSYKISCGSTRKQCKTHPQTIRHSYSTGQAPQ